MLIGVQIDPPRLLEYSFPKHISFEKAKGC